MVQKINPGIEKVLINAIKWIPTAKKYYDQFAAHNYYGLYNGTFMRQNFGSEEQFTKLLLMMVNTLWEEDQLSIIWGPDFSRSNPNPPVTMPLTYEQVTTEPTAGVIRGLSVNMDTYIQNLTAPFKVIQKYIIENTFQSKDGIPNSNRVIPNTIVHLIEQLNNALANDAMDQTRISELTGNLNTALANDATDQATITNLQAKVDYLQKPKPNIGPIRRL